MRTVHSVINRTPSKFLEEILLVDDFSDKGIFQDVYFFYFFRKFQFVFRIYIFVYSIHKNIYSLENLKGDLESYIEQWGGKVRLLRNYERQGLIRTRSRGAREAKGEVIVFLDAHCEVNTNWLPPLLAPIAMNRYLVYIFV